MPITTRLTELLDIRHPLLLAPMGYVSGGALAASVTRAGGLGLIGGGYGERDWLLDQFAAAGNAAVGVGFIGWSLARQPALLDLALDRAPRAMFLSFGELATFAPKIKLAGVTLIAQVQSVAQAREAIGEGADVIVAQGSEAGGHGATRATLPLVPAVVDIAGGIPVVAAGGIADGRGLAAALMLGASGALCGTAFFACRESLAHPGAKRAAIEGDGDHTDRSSIVDIARDIDWPEPWTIRTLRNDFVDRWRGDIAALRSDPAAERARYARAREAGDASIAATIVGEAVDLVRAEEDAGDIVARITGQAEGLLRSAGEFVVR